MIKRSIKDLELRKKVLHYMKKGFTLIELLVVIAIIGLLSSIVLVSTSGVRGRARDAKRQFDLRQIVTAMEMAYGDSSTDCGGADTYPKRGTNGIWYDINDPTNGLPKICPTTGQYLNPTPDDPISTMHYKWMGNNGDCTAVTPNIPAGQWYCIYATLETGNYFVASQRGTKVVTTPPANCACGF
jgi:prepilin-type N-terminal cleavage/methylation domain-containing protein